MTYYCHYCEELIDESELVSRLANEEDFGARQGEHVSACPICGQSTTLEEADMCEVCGEPIKPGKHLCESCHDRIAQGVKELVESFRGEYGDAKQNFFDYLEREWF